MAIFELPHDSVVRGRLPKGCEYCWRGSKLVLFVTGLCNMKCPYCPLSEKRRGKDVVYANENLVYSVDDIIEEAYRMSAEGAGITGGEPTLVLDRTIGYINLLKERFGERFHIHMYTTTVDLHTIKELSEAGLDEIRFHPPPQTWGKIERTPYYKAIDRALNTSMDVGVEIPALPDKVDDMIHLAEKLDDLGVQFLNMNELEIVESNYKELSRLGYEFRDDESVAALGSDLAALTVIYSADVDMTLHFCSSRYKDAGQLRQRFLRIARNIAKDYELVTEEGTIMRGIIIAENSLQAEEIYRKITLDLRVPKRFVRIQDREILIAPWILEDLKERIPGEKYIVEVYPTKEEFEVERIPLK
ncbi:MAG: radical SAM protein [Thermoplasmata archaeon]|nr:MAG: radical SAM protein [Thermoplasmata archaeon]